MPGRASQILIVCYLWQSPAENARVRGRGVSEPISGLQSAECDTTFESCSVAVNQRHRQSETKKKSVPQNAIDVQAPGSFASVHARLLIRKSHGFLRTNRCQACSHSKGE